MKEMGYSNSKWKIKLRILIYSKYSYTKHAYNQFML